MRTRLLPGMAALVLAAGCGGGGGGGGGGKAGPPEISIPPQNQTVTAPAAATFTVAATGNPTPTYQWNLNDLPIQGATSASYTTPSTVPPMTGESYTVTVSNSHGSVTSDPATLTVEATTATDCAPISGVYAGHETDVGHTTCLNTVDTDGQLTITQSPSTSCSFTVTNNLVGGITYYGTISGDTLSWLPYPNPYSYGGGFLDVTGVNVTFTPAQGSTPAALAGDFEWYWATCATCSAHCTGTTSLQNFELQ